MNASLLTNRELFLVLQKSTFFFDKVVDQTLRKETDITLAQFDVLLAICMSTFTTQQEVSNILCNTQASVSRQVALLLEKKYITRTQNPKNKREYKLKGTQSGNLLIKKATRILDQRFEEVFGVVSDKEKEKVVDVLSRIVGASGIKHLNPKEGALEIQKVREYVKESLKKI